LIHLDTTFLVDLLREERRQKAAGAVAFLKGRPDEELRVSVHAACELFAGVEAARLPDEERARVATLLEVVGVVYPDERFQPVYGRLLAHLERVGARIGVMDLLIGASALVEGAALVTRNVREFGRIPGLRVVSY